jgi:hypothetical protein
VEPAEVEVGSLDQEEVMQLLEQQTLAEVAVVLIVLAHQHQQQEEVA